MNTPLESDVVDVALRTVHDMLFVYGAKAPLDEYLAVINFDDGSRQIFKIPFFQHVTPEQTSIGIDPKEISDRICLYQDKRMVGLALSAAVVQPSDSILFCALATDNKMVSAACMFRAFINDDGIVDYLPMALDREHDAAPVEALAKAAVCVWSDAQNAGQADLEFNLESIGEEVHDPQI